MTYLEQVLLGLALPAAVSAMTLAVAWRPWRRAIPSDRSAGDPSGRRSVAAGPWSVAAAVGAGYVAGHAALRGWPPFPPLEATNWLFHFALAAIVPPVVYSAWGRLRWLRWVFRVVLSTALPLLVLWPLVEHTWGRTESVLWLAGLSVGTLALWSALGALVERARGALVPLALLVAAAAGGPIFVVSGSLLVGQLGGALAAALAPLPLAVALRPGRATSGVVPPALLLLTGLSINGYFYVEPFDPVLSAASILLLAVAPAAAWIAWLRPLRSRGWKATLTGALATALVVGAALLLAFLAAPEADPYSY